MIVTLALPLNLIFPVTCPLEIPVAIPYTHLFLFSSVFVTLIVKVPLDEEVISINPFLEKIPYLSTMLSVEFVMMLVP